MLIFFRNNTASLIETLLKLIVVIFGSVLIICFCNKLTKYKKSRRSKSLTSAANQEAAAAALHFSALTFAQNLQLTNNQHHLNLNHPHYHYEIPTTNVDLTTGAYINNNISNHHINNLPINNQLIIDFNDSDLQGNQQNPNQQELTSNNNNNSNQRTNLISNPTFLSANNNNNHNSYSIDYSEPCPSYEEAIAFLSNVPIPIGEPNQPGESNSIQTNETEQVDTQNEQSQQPSNSPK